MHHHMRLQRTSLLSLQAHFRLSLTGSFSPAGMCAQVLTEYADEQLPLVLEALERLEAHLTAAVVSNDPVFTQKVCCPNLCPAMLEILIPYSWQNRLQK